jgi:hypothetical protein
VSAPERPTFLAPDLPEGRPELGEIKVGDTVWVQEPSHRRSAGSPPAVLAEVASVARVWAVLKRKDDDGHPREWRMRLDTQDEGDRRYPQYNAAFRTPAQQLWHWASTEASTYLREQRITIDHGPWDSAAGKIKLARIIWEASNVGA